MSAENTVDNPRATLALQNVVASATLGVEIDLESVALDLNGADFDHEQFPGLIYRPEATEATCLVFRSGKLTCTGGRSVREVHETIQATMDAFRELGIEVTEVDVTVQNIVLDADLGEALNLEAIAIGLGLEDVEYEPEQFPGLIYRLDDPDVVVLLFGTGKLVITGTKTRDDAEEALEAIIDRLSELALLG